MTILQIKLLIFTVDSYKVIYIVLTVRLLKCVNLQKILLAMYRLHLPMNYL